MDRDFEHHVTIGDQTFHGKIPAHVKSKMFLKIVKNVIYSKAVSNNEKKTIKETIAAFYRQGGRIIFLIERQGDAADDYIVTIDDVEYVPADNQSCLKKIGATLRDNKKKMMPNYDEQAIIDALETEWGEQSEQLTLTQKMESIWAKIETSPPVQKLRRSIPVARIEDDVSNTNMVDLTAADGAATEASLSLLFDDIMSFASEKPPPVFSVEVPSPSKQSVTAPNVDQLWDQIEGDLGQDIEPYKKHYGFGQCIGKSLQRLEKAQFNGQSEYGYDREDWSKVWASDLSERDSLAWQFYVDQRLCLRFLYRIIDNDLVSRFKPFRVERIVRICLVMERANALYNMMNPVTNKQGLHWFAEADRGYMEQLLLSDVSELQALRKLEAPLDHRLRGLLDHPDLGYRNDTQICGWMTPQRAVSDGRTIDFQIHHTSITANNQGANLIER